MSSLDLEGTERNGRQTDSSHAEVAKGIWESTGNTCVRENRTWLLSSYRVFPGATHKRSEHSIDFAYSCENRFYLTTFLCRTEIMERPPTTSREQRPTANNQQRPTTIEENSPNPFRSKKVWFQFAIRSCIYIKIRSTNPLESSSSPPDLENKKEGTIGERRFVSTHGAWIKTGSGTRHGKNRQPCISVSTRQN